MDPARTGDAFSLGERCDHGKQVTRTGNETDPIGSTSGITYVHNLSDVTRDTKKIIVQSWGYIIIAFLIAGSLYTSLGATTIAIGSSLAFVYCLFQAPMWCCAENRNGTLCRENSNGLLLGCWRRQHKWQKLRMAMSRQSWAKLVRRTFSGIGGQAAALSAIGTLISAVVATITLMVR